MIELYNQLLDRWKKAFDEIDMLERQKSTGRRVVFSRNSCYNLENYHQDDFPAGGQTFGEKQGNAHLRHEYWLDTSDRPVYSCSFDQFAGFYSYSNSLVEYIEFNLKTGLPCLLQQAVYRDNLKTQFQSFRLNGGGSIKYDAYDDVGRTRAMEEIPNEEYAIHSSILTFEYENARIARARGILKAPGLPGWQNFTERYTYGKDSILDEKRIAYENYEGRLTYVRPDPSQNVEQLIGQLSTLMSVAIVETLLSNNISQPLSLLELWYRTVDNYCPYLRYTTQQEREETIGKYGDPIFWEAIFLPNGHDLIPVDPTAFERPYQQLMQIMEETDNWNLGTNMLRRTARLLTLGRLDGRVAISEDFIAYPLDGEFEINDLSTILLECGLPRETLNQWKEKNWLPD